MEYTNLIEEFARRTRDNLEVLRLAQARGENAYEVTALINSLLGLLVFPQQKYFSSIPEMSLTELADQGWPVPKVIEGEQAPNLRKIVRHLRNAISHCNIEFYIDETKQISGLRVWDKTKSGVVTWKAELSVSDLNTFAHKLIAQILNE